MAKTPQAKTKLKDVNAPSPGIDVSDTASEIEKDHWRANTIEEGLEEESRRVRRASLDAKEKDVPERLDMRKSLINPEDTLGLERIIGTRDILQVTFLHQALQAAKSVCRLRVQFASPGPPSFGTGFLVAPGVLLTNHHVIDTPESAHLSLAEFDAELDTSYVPRKQRNFNLLPGKLFVTDAALDFTFVAVNSVAHDGTPLSEYRWLVLLRESGKGLNQEAATIIQHPGGGTKQMAIRNNRIRYLPESYRSRIGEDFLHYDSDTERGSSGAPVLNDQFDVLALHHKVVPKYNAKGQPLARNGKVWVHGMGEDERAWIANEGVRISSIFRRLDRLARGSAHAARLLALLEYGEPSSVFSTLGARPGSVDRNVADGPELESTALARRAGKGYRRDFLGFDVPLPTPDDKLREQVQPLKPDAAPRTDVEGELVYTHFSILMHAKRRLALLAAVNIDGKSRRKPSVKPSWRIEGRVERNVQSDNDLYRNNPLDKGHLVRRLDPAWGEAQQEIDDAVTDTYHYVNAAPQEHSFNDGLWGDVEDYILQMAEAGDHKISVFTGPVFGDDISYGEARRDGPWLIPSRFWKVIVYRKRDGTKSATGFLLDQSDQIADLAEGFTSLPQAREVARVHQRTVSRIEELTHLDFGPLRSFDPLAQLESTKQTRRIRLPEQIVL